MPRADLPILERAAVDAGRGKPRPYKGLADAQHGWSRADRKLEFSRRPWSPLRARRLLRRPSRLRIN